jgi:hypothetical protein
MFVLTRYSYALDHYHDMSAFQLDAQFPDNSLVFSKGKRYKKFTIFMPPLDGNRVIYAYDLGEENQKLINYYPTRKVFVETDGGFRQLERNK